MVRRGLLLMLIAFQAMPFPCRADNPVVQTKFTADAAPIVVGDTVYLITSHDEDDATHFHMLDWQCYSS